MGKINEAMKLMLRNPLLSDPSFYSNFLQLCINSRAEKHGRLIHTYIFYNGLHTNMTINTKLIIFYGKVGDMVTARKVFDKMPKRDIVTWTSLLSGYSQNGEFKDALMVFKGMRDCGVKGNQFSYGSALRACSKLMCLRSGMQIQGCVYKSRFVEDVFVQCALIDMHSKCGDIKDASYVFSMMKMRDLVCWNAMIGGYSVQGLSSYAFRTFRSMLREGLSPDCFTFGNLLGSCSQAIHLPVINQIHGFVIQHGFRTHDVLSRLLIDAYARCGSMKHADFVFRSAGLKDIMSYTSMLAGYAREGNHHIDALSLFCELYRSGMTMDGYILCTMLSICANSSLLSFGRQIHAHALKYVPVNDVVMGNALIDMYAKCGGLEEANLAFTQMPERNVISWSSLIDGYAKYGLGDKAIALYKEMEEEGLRPNSVTFLSLLFACSHAGLTDEGWECFRSMIEKYNIAPSEKHYACLIDLLARGGQLEEAVKIMEKMDIQPNASLCGTILGASNVHGDISAGKIAAKHLSALSIDRSANYVSLASLYAAAGLWDDSCRTHKLMEERDLKKSPGSSLVLSSG